MGHMIEQNEKKNGHEVVATIDPNASDASIKISQNDSNALVSAVKESGAEGEWHYRRV